MNFPEGSYQNGAAMRAAPIGAFFAGDPKTAAEQTALSAVITHAHLEGRAGAMAVAAAAAITALGAEPDGDEFIDAIADCVPDGETKERLLSSKEYSPEEVAAAAENLGTGWNVTAQAPFPSASGWLVDIQDFTRPTCGLQPRLAETGTQLAQLPAGSSPQVGTKSPKNGSSDESLCRSKYLTFSSNRHGMPADYQPLSQT